MSLFENFVYKDGEIVDNSWVKWFHFGIPDEEGELRTRKRIKFAELGHCEECSALSGCYFVKSSLPNKRGEGKGLLHNNCHCELLNDKQPSVTAFCDIRKFENYIFSDKYQNNGKIKLFKSLGFNITDAMYLKKEFETQARREYLLGNYKIGKLDKYGQRINIPIIVINEYGRRIEFISGWMLHPMGLITCNTPLGG